MFPKTAIVHRFFWAISKLSNGSTFTFTCPILLFTFTFHFYFLPRWWSSSCPCGTPSPLENIYYPLLLSISYLNRMGYFTFTFTVSYDGEVMLQSGAFWIAELIHLLRTDLIYCHFLFLTSIFSSSSLSPMHAGAVEISPFVEPAHLLQNGWFHFLSVALSLDVIKGPERLLCEQIRIGFYSQTTFTKKRKKQTNIANTESLVFNPNF